VALTMTGEVEISAPRTEVWQALNDPAILAQCIPGCQTLERTENGGFAATAKVKVGPIGATFKGSVILSDLNPPNSYRLSGSGEGGVAGFAKGSALVSLKDAPSGCLLAYDVEANVGGKLAQLGSRLIDGVAKKMADQFFSSFAAVVTGGESGQGSSAATPES
jgi:uncharacterized protein